VRARPYTVYRNREGQLAGYLALPGNRYHVVTCDPHAAAPSHSDRTVIATTLPQIISGWARLGYSKSQSLYWSGSSFVTTHPELTMAPGQVLVISVSVDPETGALPWITDLKDLRITGQDAPPWSRVTSLLDEQTARNEYVVATSLDHPLLAVLLHEHACQTASVWMPHVPGIPDKSFSQSPREWNDWLARTYLPEQITEVNDALNLTPQKIIQSLAGLAVF
jgi:hypothetical protein